jgi:hypothetical protein
MVHSSTTPPQQQLDAHLSAQQQHEQPREFHNRNRRRKRPRNTNVQGFDSKK